MRPSLNKCSSRASCGGFSPFELRAMVRVHSAIRELARQGAPITRANLARESGLWRTCVFRALDQLRAMGAVSRVQGKHANDPAKWELVVEIDGRKVA